MKAELKGDANLAGIRDNVKAEIYWPDYLTLGLGIHLSNQFVILLDLEWIGYSRFSRKSHLAYDRFVFLNATFIKDMRDARRIHVGCEYQLNEKVVLRTGYLLNPWTIPEEQRSPLNPDNTFHTAHFGIKLKIRDRFNIDITAFRSFSRMRRIIHNEIGYPGGYGGPCYVLDMALSYHF